MSAFRCAWILAASLAMMACTITLYAGPVRAQDDQGEEFFEKRIRPLLVEKCFECHGPEKHESDLRLDSRDGVLAGGGSGPAVEPGDPDSSLLLAAVEYDLDDLQMPPEERLTTRQIEDLRRWIEMGVPYPGGGDGTPRTRPRRVDMEAGKEFWAFRPPQRREIPAVRDGDWPQTPIDFFVLARMEAEGLSPAARADKRTLIRRVTFDLTGLPPSRRDVEAFLADDSPAAFATLVDRLLASPAYGERWGRHWLDVARYADSNGLDENVAHGNAWRYRDYVIAAMNRDKPFDHFVLEQLAGDLLPATDDRPLAHERLVATGFLVMGPKVLAEVDEAKMEMDIVDEQVDAVGRTFLALTLGCARCHDHKFDPIDAEDYYALAGIFKSTRTMESFTKIARWHENPLPTAADEQRVEAHKRELEKLNSALAGVIDEATKQLREARGAEQPLPDNPESLFPKATKDDLARRRAEIKKLEEAAPLVPSAMGVRDGSVHDVAIHVRGSHLQLGKRVPRGFPRVLVDQSGTLDGGSSGRLRLAEWLVDPRHPLTSRVIVNRVWRWHFGRGIVATPDNFGYLGQRPSHPQLLDWLAAELIARGWSLKDLHRAILLSSTYQMSSAADERSRNADPENLWLSRAPIRRLEAEAIRDGLLQVSGLLDRSMGGTQLNVKNREFIFNHTSEDETTYTSHRRSLYLPIVRNHLYDVFQLFDYTDASVLNGDRSTTIVAPQALFMMNSELARQVSDNLALRALVAEPTDRRRIQWIYQTALSRPPTVEEVSAALRFLDEAAELWADQSSSEEQHGRRCWQSLCQVVLSSNEFLFIR